MAELENANVQIEGFTSQKRRQAFQGSIDIFTGGIEAFAGIATQLGLSNDEFEETITNLVAVGATANGIRTVTAGFFDLREALRSSAVAQRALNLVTAANPYVLLATAVLALGAAYVIFSDDTEEATKAQEELDEAISTTQKTVDGSIESLIGLAEAQIVVARADALEYQAIIDKLSTDPELREFAKGRLAERNAEIAGLEATVTALKAQRIANQDAAEQDAKDAAARQKRIENLKDEIALYTGDEDGLIALKVKLLNEELALATTESGRRAILRQIRVLTQEVGEAEETLEEMRARIAEEKRIRDEKEAEVQRQFEEERETRQRRELEILEAQGITQEELFDERLERAETEDEIAEILHQRALFRIREMTESEEEACETKEKIDDACADNMTKNINDQIGALNDFATQAALLAEESKGLAIAAVITNAAVAGIAAWRSWTEDGPFGQPGNTIAAVAQIGIIGLGAVQAIKSINEAGSGSTAPSASSFVGGPTVATPATGQSQAPSFNTNTQSIAPNIDNIVVQQPTVLLTPTNGPGSLASTMAANDKRQQRRRL